MLARLSMMFVFCLLGLGTLTQTVYGNSCKTLAYRSSFDLYGSDLKADKMDSVDADECAARCCNRPDCVAYTVAIAPGSADGCTINNPCCYLKNAIPSFVPSSVAQIASGIVGNCSLVNFKEGQDLPGNDIVTVQMPSLGPNGIDECAARCCALSGCHAFTVALAPSAYMQCGQGSNCCYLKSEASGYTPSSTPGIGSGEID